MKRLIIFYPLLLAIAVMLSAGFGSVALADINDGLSAYYPFNGNANDETGNGYDGVIIGDTALTDDRLGYPDSAYRFDGSGDYIDIGTALNFPSWNAYSVSVWFLNDGGGDWSQGYGQKIIDKTVFWHDFYIRVNNVGDLAYVTYEGGGGGINDNSKDYRDNMWHHVIVTKNGSHGELWVDGQLAVSTDNAKTVLSSGKLLFGYSLSSDSFQRKFWSGKIDDIRIYDRILSEAEIHQLHLMNLSPVEAIDYITNYFEESVGDGSIVGESGPFWDPETAITYMSWLLNCATQGIENELKLWSCLCLRRALKRCDGKGNRVWNMDYISGDARDEFAAMVVELLNDLGCSYQ